MLPLIIPSVFTDVFKAVVPVCSPFFPQHIAEFIPHRLLKGHIFQFGAVQRSAHHFLRAAGWLNQIQVIILGIEALGKTQSVASAAEKLPPAPTLGLISIGFPSVASLPNDF